MSLLPEPRSQALLDGATSPLGNPRETAGARCRRNLARNPTAEPAHPGQRAASRLLRSRAPAAMGGRRALKPTPLDAHSSCVVAGGRAPPSCYPSRRTAPAGPRWLLLWALATVASRAWVWSLRALIVTWADAARTPPSFWIFEKAFRCFRRRARKMSQVWPPERQLVLRDG